MTAPLRPNQPLRKEAPALACPHCGNDLAKLPRSTQGIVHCPCGLIAELQLARFQEFTWLFDSNSHEIHWNVDKLKAWLGTPKQEPVIRAPIPSKLLRELWEMNSDKESIDFMHAMQSDTTRPIIAIQHPSLAFYPYRGGPNLIAEYPPLLVVDGWHRLYKAIMQGMPELPAIILTSEQEARFRVVDVIFL